MNKSVVRHRHILDFALSSLLRKKGKNGSLLMIYLLIVFLIASVMFFTQALKREASLILKDAPDLIVQKLVAGRQDMIPDSYADEIRSIKSVVEVHPRLWGYYFDAAVGANYTLMASDRQLLAPESVVIGSGVARVRRLAPGDLMTFTNYRGSFTLLEVQSILPDTSELEAADMIIMSEDDLRDLFNFPLGLATDLAVTVRNPHEIPTVAAKILKLFPDSRPVLKSEIMRTYDAIFDWRGGMMVVILSAAVFAFIIFAWDKATGLSAEERKEIGILKSIGWETADVLLLKFWEGAVVSLAAFVGGVLLAYCHVFFFSASLFEHALKGWAVLYPQFRLTPFIDPYQLAVLFILTVVPYTLSTIIPSWRAATIDPDAAMRS